MLRGDPWEHPSTEVVVGDPYIDLGAEPLGFFLLADLVPSHLGHLQGPLNP